MFPTRAVDAADDDFERQMLLLEADAQALAGLGQVLVLTCGAYATEQALLCRVMHDIRPAP